MREFDNLHKTNQEMAILLHLLEEDARKKEDQQNFEVAELNARIERLNRINQENESQLQSLEEVAQKKEDQYSNEMSAMVEKIENLNKKAEERDAKLKTLDEEARIKENRQHIENAALKEKIEHLKTFQEKASQLQKVEEESRKKKDEYLLEIATLNEQIEHLNKTNMEKADQMKKLEEEKAELTSKLTSLRIENEKLLNEKEVLSIANAPITCTAGSRFIAQPPVYSGSQVQPCIPPQGRSCFQPPEHLSPSRSLSILQLDDNGQNIPPRQQKSPSPTALQSEEVIERRKFIPKSQFLKRIPIVKKKVVNNTSHVSTKSRIKKQVPINVLVAEEPWRPHGSKQHQLLKPSHHNNKTPTNKENTKSAKRKLRLVSPIGSPMFTSTPNNGRKFPQFAL